MDLSELRDIDSLLIEGTDTLVKGGRFRLEGMVYRGVGTRMSAIKFARTLAPIYTIVGLLILYTKNVLGLVSDSAYGGLVRAVAIF